jgi:trk system potassium uptake protein TrkH
MRHPLVISILGFLLVANGALMLTALPFSIAYGGSDLIPLLASSGISIAVGLVLWFTFRTTDVELRLREAFAIVTLGWVVVSLFGSLPFLLSGAIPDFTDAYFETMSGYSTTGASILDDVEALPHGLLYWRSMTQWIGGMGIILLSVAILPLLGVGGMQLFQAEVPGVTVDKISPRLSQTAKILWGVYGLLTVVQMVLLWIGGMTLFDAVCHSFTTVATGGFSTKNTGIAHYQSEFIQYTVIVFMFLAGASFTLHFQALRGEMKRYVTNDEFKFYLVLVIFTTLVVFSVFPSGLTSGIEEQFRASLFQVVSITTTTGFATFDYELWLPAGQLILLLLMFNGACAGSTAGGVKLVRILLLLKNSIAEITKLVHPKAVIPVRFNGKGVSQDIISEVLAFFVLYITIFVAASVLMTLVGLDILSAAGSVAATLGNVGPGIGSVGPFDNYGHIPTLGKWILTACMLIGRLEIFTVFVLFSSAFWKK